jgi:hypothetical protein
MFIPSSRDKFPDLPGCCSRIRAALPVCQDLELVVFVLTESPDKGIHTPVWIVHDPESAAFSPSVIKLK